MLKKNMISAGLGLSSLLVISTSFATSFNSFDPKSMAMGGAGVAVPNPGSAPFFNPALLSIADSEDDFALELPILGGHIADSDDFIDAIDNFDDSLADQVDFAITSYNGAPGTSAPVVSTVNNLNRAILTLSNKPVQFDVNAGLVVGIPSKNYGMALSITGSANFAGIFDYQDSTTVSNLTNDLAALDFCYTLTGAAQVNCIQTTAFTFVDSNPASPTFGQVNFTAQSDTGASSDILSKARFVGIGFTEVGLTFSREFFVFGADWAVGLTPKFVSLTVFDYEANADSADTDNLDADNFSTDYNDINIDVGIARDYGNGWRMGFVIKNLISNDYKAFNIDSATGAKTATGTIISVKPQARIGVSRSNSWSIVTVDLDLNESESLASFSENSQYLATGVEFNAFDWAQLRLGYRADLVDSDRSIASAGIGLSPFGAHMDLAVAGNSDEIGAAFQLGFRF